MAERRVAAILACAAAMVFAFAATAGGAIRTFDAEGQEIDYGCDATHKEGQGWVCWNVEPGESRTALPPELRAGDPASLANASKRGPIAHKADTYIWNFDRTGWYGIGSTRIGEVNTTGRVSFNGRQGTVNSGARWVYGPPIRVEMIVDSYNGQLTRTGGTSAIRPTAPSFTTGSVSMPVWNPFFHGYEYFLSWNYYIRSSGVENPSSATGTFHAGPVHSPSFFCVNGLGSCYFP
jgi:hypothetical protein